MSDWTIVTIKTWNVLWTISYGCWCFNVKYTGKVSPILFQKYKYIKKYRPLSFLKTVHIHLMLPYTLMSKDQFEPIGLFTFRFRDRPFLDAVHFKLFWKPNIHFKPFWCRPKWTVSPFEPSSFIHGRPLLSSFTSPGRPSDCPIWPKTVNFRLDSKMRPWKR